MDFACIETWLALPEFRVTGQVMRPHTLDLHLERRDTALVCPAVRGTALGAKRVDNDASAICPSWIARSPCGCTSNGFSARIATIGPGSTARRLVSASSGPSGCTIKCVRNTCTGARAMNWRVAMASRHARCFAGRLKRAMADGPASWVGPWALMHTPGVRAIATIRSSWTWTTVDRSPR